MSYYFMGLALFLGGVGLIIAAIYIPIYLDNAYHYIVISPKKIGNDSIILPFNTVKFLIENQKITRDYHIKFDEHNIVYTKIGKYKPTYCGAFACNPDKEIQIHLSLLDYFKYIRYLKRCEKHERIKGSLENIELIKDSISRVETIAKEQLQRDIDNRQNLTQNIKNNLSKE